MMRCEICSHEYTRIDFVALRNLCEHVYLDSLAQKLHPSSVPEPDHYFSGLKITQPA